MELNIIRKHPHPSGGIDIERLFTAHIPDDPIMISKIMIAIAEGMQEYNNRTKDK